MDATEPHEVLGVDEDASEEEIKRAYREKVKQYHPDISDADDAERLFRRVREAYDSLLSGGGASTSSGGSRGRSKERSKNEDGHNRRKRERAGRRRRTPERFKTMERYGDGWRLAVCRDGRHTGEWVVYTESADTTGDVVYLNDNGGTSHDELYFGTRKQAETCYESYVEKKRDRNETGRSTTDGRRRGGGRRTGTERTGTRNPNASTGAETTESFDVDGGMGKKAGGFDSLWSLYTTSDEDAWAVVAEFPGSPYYLNADGRQQHEAFWFDSRSEAETAYEGYMEDAADRGTASRNLTGAGGNGRGGNTGTADEKIVANPDDEGSRPPVSALGAALDVIGTETLRRLSGVVLLLVVLLLILRTSGVV